MVGTVTVTGAADTSQQLATTGGPSPIVLGFALLLVTSGVAGFIVRRRAL